MNGHAKASSGPEISARWLRARTKGGLTFYSLPTARVNYLSRHLAVISLEALPRPRRPDDPCRILIATHGSKGRLQFAFSYAHGPTGRIPTAGGEDGRVGVGCLGSTAR